MIRNFITGAGGFVASHLIELLLEKGEEVHASYRWNEDLSRIDKFKDKITLIPMDLMDSWSVFMAIYNSRPDYLYHLAAQSYVDASFVYPSETIQINTIGTLNLLEAVKNVRDKIKSDTKFDPIVHICSSSEVYGQVEKEDIPIKETQEFNPANPYAVGKIGADMLGLLYWKNYKIKTIRTRMFTHTGYGRSMLSAECAFARQIARIEKGLQEPIIKVGNLDSIRTFADVKDAVKAYWIMMRKCEPGEVYNIGGTETMTIGEMLNRMLSISEARSVKIEVDKKLLRPSDVTMQIPDISKFQKATGWKPEIKFEDTLKDVLTWWRERV